MKDPWESEINLVADVVEDLEFLPPAKSSDTDSDDADAILAEYVEEAKRIFGLPCQPGEQERERLSAEQASSPPSAYGFIGTAHNLPPLSHIPYGWSSLYYPCSKLKNHVHRKGINTIQRNKKRGMRLYLYNLNFIDEKDVYAWFVDLVFKQNNSSRIVTNKESGETKLIDEYGRWSKRKPWGSQVRKRLKGALETIDNPLLLTLNVSQALVEERMPFNTNFDAVMFSIMNIGGWVSRFLRKLRKYQERHNIDWRYIGWVLEFQKNGFPHVHIIMAGDWIGNIKEVAALWPYSEAQGVDYTNRAKLRKRLGHHVDAMRLANYVTAYVAQGGVAVVEKGDRIGKGKKAEIWTGERSVHKGYAFLAFFGGRIFNLAHEKKGNANGDM